MLSDYPFLDSVVFSVNINARPYLLKQTEYQELPSRGFGWTNIVYDVACYQGNVYACGRAYHSSSRKHKLGFWCNDIWTDIRIENGVTFENMKIVLDVGQPIIIATYRNNLHDYRVGYYRGGNWIDVSDDVPSNIRIYDRFSDIAVMNGDLFILGTKNSQKGYWLNGNWNPFLDSWKKSTFNSICVHEEDGVPTILVSGHLQHFGYWKNGEKQVCPNGVKRATVHHISINGKRVTLAGSYIDGSRYEHAFVWRDGEILDLGEIPNSSVTQILSIQGHDVICGSNRNRTCLWVDGSIVKISDDNINLLSAATLDG